MIIPYLPVGIKIQKVLLLAKITCMTFWFQPRITIYEHYFLYIFRQNGPPLTWSLLTRDWPIVCCAYLANTKYMYNAAQRLVRWSNIVQMLYKYFVFTVNSSRAPSANHLLTEVNIQYITSSFTDQQSTAPLGFEGCRYEQVGILFNNISRVRGVM